MQTGARPAVFLWCLVALVPITIFAIAGVAIYAAIHDPDHFGIMMLGGSIGWTLYFFMRLFRIFSPQTLAATIGAVLGGVGLEWLTHLSGSSVSAAVQYYTGVGIGFLVYALYAGLCSWLYATGVLKTRQKFQVAIGCGAGVDDNLEEETEALMQLEDAIKKWVARKMTEREFKDFLSNLHITFRRVRELLESKDLECTPEELERFRRARFLPFSGSEKHATDKQKPEALTKATPGKTESLAAPAE